MKKEGIKMVDIESLIKSLRLSWLKRIFSDNSGAWKNYLEYILKDSGGLVLFKCNYNVKDLQITSTFYLLIIHLLFNGNLNNVISSMDF